MTHIPLISVSSLRHLTAIPIAVFDPYRNHGGPHLLHAPEAMAALSSSPPPEAMAPSPLPRHQRPWRPHLLPACCRPRRPSPPRHWRPWRSPSHRRRIPWQIERWCVAEAMAVPFSPTPEDMAVPCLPTLQPSLHWRRRASRPCPGAASVSSAPAPTSSPCAAVRSSGGATPTGKGQRDLRGPHAAGKETTEFGDSFLLHCVGPTVQMLTL
jgi:hypothetical protein